MTDLDHLFLEAWNQILPRLKSDPAELSARLSRRRSPTLLRPPRAWCIAIRASDTRITEATAAITPDFATSIPNPCYTHRYLEHEVTLFRSTLDRLCRPVEILPTGLDWQQVARLLGTHEESLRHAMRSGFFRVRYVQKFLHKQRGKPIPFLMTDKLLDAAQKLVC